MATLFSVGCHHHSLTSVFRTARIPAYWNGALLANKRAVHVELPVGNIRKLEVVKLRRYGDCAGDVLGDTYGDPGARRLGACDLPECTVGQGGVEVSVYNGPFHRVATGWMVGIPAETLHVGEASR